MTNQEYIEAISVTLKSDPSKVTNAFVEHLLESVEMFKSGQMSFDQLNESIYNVASINRSAIALNPTLH